MLRHPQAGAIESARNGSWRGDVTFVDVPEPDRAKPQLHHRVHRRHAEKKTPARFEHARDLAQALLVLVQVLEDREAYREIELRGLVGQFVNTALDEPGGAPMATEPRLNES